MKIAVLGTGRVGCTLGGRWIRAGHEVVFGSREPGEMRNKDALGALPNPPNVTTWREAAEGVDVVLLAVPWPAVRTVLDSLVITNGQVLIDCTNPLNADFTGLDLGHSTSAAEELAARLRGGHIVKAFNTVSAATMANPLYGGSKATLFYCGNDASAKAIVRTLAEDLGFEPVDAGPLQVARYLEPLAMLYIRLAMKEGWGGNCAFSIMRR